ncbi:MAG: hypothetical protein LBM02_09570 [Lachnospiraceae bacterium]|jgi:hypothetical protein|nr:hypothetical protein [Lachnospiraceae bacterium]
MSEKKLVEDDYNRSIKEKDENIEDVRKIRASINNILGDLESNLKKSMSKMRDLNEEIIENGGDSKVLNIDEDEGRYGKMKKFLNDEHEEFTNICNSTINDLEEEKTNLQKEKNSLKKE